MKSLNHDGQRSKWCCDGDGRCFPCHNHLLHASPWTNIQAWPRKPGVFQIFDLDYLELLTHWLMYTSLMGAWTENAFFRVCRNFRICIKPTYASAHKNDAGWNAPVTSNTPPGASLPSVLLPVMLKHFTITAQPLISWSGVLLMSSAQHRCCKRAWMIPSWVTMVTDVTVTPCRSASQFMGVWTDWEITSLERTHSPSNLICDRLGFERAVMKRFESIMSTKSVIFKLSKVKTVIYIYNTGCVIFSQKRLQMCCLMLACQLAF